MDKENSGRKLAECLKKFDALKASCADMRKGLGEADKGMGKQGRTFKNMLLGIQERIQELMDEGHVGKALKDYVGDKEVRQMYVVAHDCMHTMNAGSAGLSPEMKTKLAKVTKEHDKLVDEVGAIIAAKKEKAKAKAAPSAKPEDQQTIPKLEKLLKDLKAFERDKTGLAGLGSVSAGETNADTKDFQDGLKKMIAGMKPDPSKAKNGAAALKKEGLEQSKIDASLRQAKGFRHDIDAAIAKAKAAQAAGTRDALRKEQAAIDTALGKLEEMADRYKRLLGDKKTVDKLKEDPKTAKLLVGIKEIRLVQKTAMADSKAALDLSV